MTMVLGPDEECVGLSTDNNLFISLSIQPDRYLTTGTWMSDSSVLNIPEIWPVYITDNSADGCTHATKPPSDLTMWPLLDRGVCLDTPAVWPNPETDSACCVGR